MVMAIRNLEDLPVSLKVNQVAQILGISRKVAYDLARRKDFPSVRISKRIVIPRDRFLAWYNNKADEPLE